MNGTNDHLRRELSTAAAAAFVVTNMIGSGIFTVPAFVRVATGNGGASLAVWIVGGGIALTGALCYAELATLMPEAGGEYHYLTQVYGRLWGFLSGWISFLVGFSAAIAASALGASAYASAFLPAWNPAAPVIAGIGITQGAALASALIATLSIVHSVGVRPSGKLQSVIAGTVIGAILLFSIAGFATGRGDWSGVTEISFSKGAWWVALVQVYFAYSGWNAAAYLAGEVANPRRTLPRALIGGTLVVVALYLLLNTLFLYAVPAASWEPTIAIGKAAAERLFGPFGAKAISGIITFTIIGSASAMVAAGPRVYYAMARDGMAHPVFARLHPRGGAPRVAILLQALVAMTLALTGAFEALLIYAGASLSLFTGLAVSSLYILPRNPPGGAESASTRFRTPGYPVTPAIFLSLILISFVQSLRERPIPTGAALATILIGIGIYFLSRRRGWLRDTQ
ncbi:MAG: APC family permease [Blastocatellia bacterium]